LRQVVCSEEELVVVLEATYLHAVWHCELALFHVQKPLVCEHCTAVMDVHSC